MNRKVKSLLVLHDIKMVDIAKELGVSRVTVSIVITGKGKSRRIQQAIADMLGKPYRELWPNGNGHNNPHTPFIKGDFHPLPPPAGDKERR